jgi:putative membrane protein
MGFLGRMAISAVGLWLAASVVSGISIQGDGPLVLSALVLGVVNAVVRPLFILLTLPLTVLSLGLFLWPINAGMILLVASLVDGFTVASFGAALVAAAIMSLTGWFASAFVAPRGRHQVTRIRWGR